METLWCIYVDRGIARWMDFVRQKWQMGCNYYKVSPLSMDKLVRVHFIHVDWSVAD